MFELKDKVALVTGAASGIGFGYVKELLRNELKGVALVDIDVVKGQKALEEIRKEFGNDTSIFVKADVTDKTQLEDAFETTVKTFKQLDIVINNAGIFQERQWEKCIAVNLVAVIAGTFLAIEKYFPEYKSGSEGVIINTASSAGLMPWEAGATYSATKSAVVQFTRSMGGKIRYETTKVRIVAICPGFTDTSIVNIKEEQLSEPYLSDYSKMLDGLSSQSPEVLAKHVMDIIRNASTGSIWLGSQGCCTKVQFPEYLNSI